MEVTPLIEVRERSQLRRWLEDNHASASQCWVTCYRTKVPRSDAVSYLDVVEEALCFGWIDSTCKKLSDGRLAQRISPRRKGSHWTQLNRQRCADLEKRGLMTDEGRRACGMKRIICYIPMLEGQAEDVQSWADTVRERLGVIPVLLPTVDWNDDLTPWPAEPIFKKGKPFSGKADAYLERLESEIIPGIEAEMGIVPDERWLLGVSLAGLFAVWTATKTNLFTRIGSVSGSFWYPGFVEWLQGQTLSAKQVYVSLGDKEAVCKNKHLQSIADDTASVVRILGQKGIQTTFEWTDGTHFGPVIPRLEKAFISLKAP